MSSDSQQQLRLYLSIASQHDLLEGVDVDGLVEEFDQNPTDAAGFLCSRTALTNAELSLVECLAAPEIVAPGYHVIDLIGRGGMGHVFLAHQSRMNRLVALKTVHVSDQRDFKQIRRFRREARVLGRLQHPNIVMAYDCGETSRHLFLSMEFVRGPNLESYMSHGGQFDESTVWFLVRQIVSALKFANSCSVIHRDLKPANVLLCRPPVGLQQDQSCPWVKLTDFGLSVLVSAETGDREERITQEFAGVGTPAYASPEQALGEVVDCRADIYSLGMTAYHLATGRAPFQGESVKSILTKKLTGESLDFEQLEETCTPPTVKLIRRMTRSTANTRFSDYDSLLQALDAAHLGQEFTPIDEDLYTQCLATLPQAVTNLDSSPISKNRLSGSSEDLVTVGDFKYSTHIDVPGAGQPASWLKSIFRRRSKVLIAGLVLLFGAAGLLVSFQLSNRATVPVLQPSVVADRKVICNGSSLGDLLLLQGRWSLENRNGFHFVSGHQGWLHCDVTRWWSEKESQSSSPVPHWYRWDLEVGVTDNCQLEIHFGFDEGEAAAHHVLRVGSPHKSDYWSLTVGQFANSGFIASKSLRTGVNLNAESKPLLIKKGTLDVIHIVLEFRNGNWFIIANDQMVSSFVSDSPQSRMTLDVFATKDGLGNLQLLKFEQLAELGEGQTADRLDADRTMAESSPGFTPLRETTRSMTSAAVARAIHDSGQQPGVSFAQCTRSVLAIVHRTTPPFGRR